MISYIQKKKIYQKSLTDLLQQSIDHNHFTNNGPVKRLLEDYLTNLLNIPQTKRVLCISNGTTALHALMWLYDKKFGRKLKWITPSFTFPSCVVGESNTEVLDISPSTYTVDINSIKDEDFDGIIITNLFGTIVEFDYEAFKDKIIITDNASSFMTPDIMLLGNASFSSLHHTKTLGFGEGGFIVCDEEDYHTLQSIASFGFNGVVKEYSTQSSNFKMSDVSAAYILQHIKQYDIARHYEIQKTIANKIGQDRIFNYSPNVFYGNLPILFDRNILVDEFNGCGIEVNKYYKPIKDTPNAAKLYNRIINFPLYCTLTDEEVETICNEINER